MDLLHRKAQSYKVINKNDLFWAWKDFNKTFCGISTYHKWMFKQQISSIFNFRYVKEVWISGVLGVKNILTRKTWNTDFIIICHKLWINMKIACEPFAYLKFYIFSWRIAFTWSGSFSESFRILCRRVYGRLVRVVQSVNNRYILLLMHDFNSMGQVLHE